MLCGLAHHGFVGYFAVWGYFLSSLSLSPFIACDIIDVFKVITLAIMLTDKLVRTTISIPAELLEIVDGITSAGIVRSRNEFVAQALRREIEWQKRQEIDAALAEMAQDPKYHSTVRQMESEFAGASWDALPVEGA
jgi:Arc/MetJ-type ribon-helix-helix transcriptional regulator